MPSIKLDSGIEIGFREEGAGRALVLVHGFTSSGWVWEPVLPGLAEQCRIIAPDLKGHGSSSKPLDAEYSVSRFALELAEFLRRREVFEFVLGGHSMGGMVAMTFLLEQAWRGFNPQGLILMSTAARARNDEQRRHLLRLWRENLKDGRFDLPEKMLRGFFALAFSPPYARQHPDVVDRAYEIATLVPDTVKLRVMDHLVDEYDLRERVSELALPTLILQGSDDALITGSHFLRTRIADSRFFEYPGTGHMLTYEATDWVVPAMAEFIASLDGRSPGIAEY